MWRPLHKGIKEKTFLAKRRPWKFPFEFGVRSGGERKLMKVNRGGEEEEDKGRGIRVIVSPPIPHLDLHKKFAKSKECQVCTIRNTLYE